MSESRMAINSSKRALLRGVGRSVGRSVHQSGDLVSHLVIYQILSFHSTLLFHIILSACHHCGCQMTLLRHYNDKLCTIPESEMMASLTNYFHVYASRH
jgi:hypothetical protein